MTLNDLVTNSLTPTSTVPADARSVCLFVAIRQLNLQRVA